MITFLCKHINLLHTRLCLYMNNYYVSIISDEILFHYKVLVIHDRDVIVYEKTFSYKISRIKDETESDQKQHQN